jgi:DNA-binding NarL/FixJ family response regulator
MTGTAEVRILIVDDDPLVRAGLAQILGGAPSLSVVAQAGNGREAIGAVAEHNPDVVLIDIRMPVMDGIEATTEILARANPPKVIVLTTFDVDDYVLRALAVGASGFLLKDTDPEDIIAAVHKVAGGEHSLSPSVTATVIKRAVTQQPVSSTALAQLGRLTEREHEVALAIGRGLSNSEISRELFMSLATVKVHVGRIFAKLEVESRVQIAVCVHQAGLGEPGR